jgi:hypothetical protein
MAIARPTLFISAVCLVALSPSPASAWGSKGHEYVGTLASKLLNPSARSHVAALLGPKLPLSLAAVWADCAKNALGPPKYRYNPRELPSECKRFPANERAAMWAYTRANWSNCEYAHKLSNCHKAFHFADVNVHEHDNYDAAFFGAHPYDVVQAINALVATLKCPDGQTCDIAPFPGQIASKREALILLAHFVGDLHQPLHVGAVYLDPATAEETDDSGAETIGGNALLLTPGGANLHHDWDTISNATPSPAAIAQACLLAPLPNPTPEPTEAWASESVAAAKAAYVGLTFAPDSKAGEWDIRFADRTAYIKSRHKVQNQQLIRAGARLAALLNSIWPSTKKAAACH